MYVRLRSVHLWCQVGVVVRLCRIIAVSRHEVRVYRGWTASISCASHARLHVYIVSVNDSCVHASKMLTSGGDVVPRPYSRSLVGQVTVTQGSRSIVRFMSFMSLAVHVTFNGGS